MNNITGEALYDQVIQNSVNNPDVLSDKNVAAMLQAQQQQQQQQPLSPQMPGAILDASPTSSFQSQPTTNTSKSSSISAAPPGEPHHGGPLETFPAFENNNNSLQGLHISSHLDPATINSAQENLAKGGYQTFGGNTVANNANASLGNTNASLTAPSNTSLHNSNVSSSLTSQSPNIGASLFPFHNPFDISSYPITNPPLFDSTMALPYFSSDGVPRRRRISISNGQIGQIVNHEAFFEDDVLDVGMTFSEQHTPLNIPLRQSFQQQSVPQQQPGQNVQQNISGRQQQQQQPSVSASVQQLLIDTYGNNQNPIPGTGNTFANQQQQPQQHLQVPQSQGSTKPSSAGPGLPESLSNAAGVPPPNHQLIYNNEVIYNPNNGPIPGTAAWKKERLLERNRIAASKCRQRKKQAQLQLQGNVTKMEHKLREEQIRLQKYEKLFSLYNKVLSEHFDNGGSLDKLRKFVSINDVNKIELDEISK
ncbi:uncharacterized protein RJT20DRAFT_134749 [Scheffersomyces xylosifermentans]|uniref:uncharacterized protein n=1 Tax=Scheffersomyces xylosifermentans TaxID=1304137 RepID=UPI00315D19F2